MDPGMEVDSSSSSWCIEKYRNLYDSEDIWIFKEAFMRNHKESIPEDQLICLTQAMVNQELLGCLYPAALRQRIEELGGILLKQFRVMHKRRTKRTFVSASTAAQDYVKRTCDATNSVPANKRARFAQETTPGPPIPDPFLGKYGRLILFQSPFDTSDTLQTACAKCHIPVKEEAKTDGKEHTSEVYVNGLLVATGRGETKAIAKKEGKLMAMTELSKIYYTIRLKVAVLPLDANEEGEEQSTTDYTPKNASKNQKKPLNESNIGFRLLRSAGWQPGTALRPGGPKESLEVKANHNRSGLGQEPKSNVEHYKEMVHSYAAQTTFYDLVFDARLDKTERSRIHKLAKTFELLTKSRTVVEDDVKLRQLVLSKKLDLFHLGKLLLAAKQQGTEDTPDGLFKKYELIEKSD